MLNHDGWGLGAAGLFASLAIAGCERQPEITAEEPLDTAIPVVDASFDASKPHACPTSLPGPSMVEAASPKGNPYCIDSREVTQGEFFKFLDQFLENPTVSSQPKADAGKWPEPTGCEWNTSLLPPYLAEPCHSLAPLAFSRKNEHPDYPVACVNWCSAASYCLWAGKRLCGKIGGGSLKAAEVADPSLGEWSNVCTQGGTTSYGYGDSVKGDLPSPGNLYNGKEPLPADSASQCRGTNPPFDKIQGIGCNVAEWQDDCETGSYATACAVQAFAVSGEPEGRCDSRFAALQRDNDIRIGFRCCHD